MGVFGLLRGWSIRLGVCSELPGGFEVSRMIGGHVQKGEIGVYISKYPVFDLRMTSLLLLPRLYEGKSVQ